MSNSADPTNLDLLALFSLGQQNIKNLMPIVLIRNKILGIPTDDYMIVP